MYKHVKISVNIYTSKSHSPHVVFHTYIITRSFERTLATQNSSKHHKIFRNRQTEHAVRARAGAGWGGGWGEVERSIYTRQLNEP